MNKKEYKKPVMKVVELEATAMLTKSNFEEVEIDDSPYTGPWG